jgi:S-layer protein
VDGGAGSDTLKMNEAALTTQLTNVSNFETISFNANALSGAVVTFDLSKINSDMSTIVFDADDHGSAAKDHIVSNHTDQTIKITNTTADASSGNTQVTINNKSDSGADVLNVTIEEANDAQTSDIDSLTAANYETVNLTSTKKATTTTAVENQIDVLAIASAKSAVITGNTDLQIDSITGGSMTSFDASGLTGKLAATFASADKITATAASGNTTFAFGTTLDKNDTVVGGAGKDTVTATLSGSITDDTGKLNISGVETITLTTGSANTLDFTNITGASTIAVSANTQTITGYDLGATLQTTGAATVKLTAADATGADDTLKIQQKLDGNIDNVIEGKNIENVTIEVYDTGATANVAGFDLDTLEVSTVTFTQNALSSANADVDLAGTKFHKNVSTVTSTTMLGAQTFSAADATNAVTFNLSGTGLPTITGSGKADIFNIASTAAIAPALTGGAGTDIVNIAVTTGFVDPSDMAVETVNVTVAAGTDITLGNNQPFNAASTKINLLGGNSVSTFDADGTGTTLAATVTSFDASTFGGNVLLLVADDSLDNTVAIKAGALVTDAITTTYTAAATDKPNMTGIEILNATISDGATSSVTSVIDTSGSTGITTVSLTLADGDSGTVSGLTGSETIQVISATNTTAANTVTATLADATGAADSIKFKLKGATGGSNDDGLILATSDIETVEVYADSAESISLASLAMTAASATMGLTVTGDSALTISALNADVTSIDASGMITGGSVVMTGRSATAASTYTGYTGNDTFIMMNTGDVLDAGTGTGDKLDINATGALGAVAVDLSSATDQISSMNGLANTAIQKGFDNVDLAGYTLNGSSITGHATANTIVGSSQVDVINPGLGADSVTAGSGNDVITITEATSAVDTLFFTGTANSAATNGSDTITGFVNGADILELDAIANGVTKVYEEVASDAGDITTAANVIVFLDEGNDVLATIATLIAADTTVTATNGFFVFGDGTDAFVYHSTDLAGNGTETLIATLTGIADCSDFVTADFIFA